MKNFKLANFAKIEDFGVEYYLNLFQINNFCLFQFFVSLPTYSSCPGISIDAGYTCLLGLNVDLIKLHFSVDIATWQSRNLNYFNS